eukprot:4879767-Amphidinium_carterae.1
MDVTLQMTVSEQPCCLTVPCLRFRSVVPGIDEVWSLAFWGQTVTRGLLEPLGEAATDVREHA